MARSIKASVTGLKIANDAFNLKGRTQEYLAGSVGCSRQTVIKFLAGRPIEPRLFQEICAELKLEWDEIAELEANSKPPSQTSNLDALVREVRTKVSASIQKRCGTMRVLDMEQPITIDSIYTSVNILEKISRNQRRTVDELLEGCDRENFDRFILGAVQQKRIPGLEAVEKHDKLLILGKPGAGKTTFLKWLALQCKEGKLHKDRVPFFVTLKEFAEIEGKPSLVDFISQQLTECGIDDAKSTVQRILQGGRAIILLDGLDEVRSIEHDRVLNTIRQTSEQLDINQFVMTCRIAANEYTFADFTEVEVADFAPDQIAEFASKWFQSKDSIKADKFLKHLNAYPGLQKLATNPLLLTFLCLVFEEQARFPANRSELYQEGLDLLLKKWDVNQNIKRDEVYKQLSPKRKEDLLSQVAYITFDRSEYFFKQKFVEEQIQDYIRNLPNVSNDPEALQLDSEAVLNSISAQHGLLMERARGIYSFSHLTFHEYFTARQLKEKFDDENFDNDFSDLVSHLKENKWREVFLLTVAMLKNADHLLQAMKQQIDNVLAQDRKLQEFLVWVEHKSCCVEAPYKPAAIRAFYFDNDRNFLNVYSHCRARSLARDIDKDIALGIERNLNLTAALLLGRISLQDISLGDLCKHLKLVDDLSLDLNITFALSKASSNVVDSKQCNLNNPRELELVMNLITEVAQYLDLDLDIIHTIAPNKNCELQLMLQKIESQLPKIGLDSQFDCLQWWKLEGQGWINQLKLIMIMCRNIGYDRQFSRVQEVLIHDYYTANRLLVDCLNSDCNVSKEVREEIESTLLLPIESIRSKG